MNGSMPLQKPGRSKQDYGTSTEFLKAVQHTFGVRNWDFDLAAHSENKIPCYDYYGPGSSFAEDSLTAVWPIHGNSWLNPPFENIDKWAAKLHDHVGKLSGRIFMLTPASIGTNWFSEHVAGIAHVVALSPRLTFVGCKDPYPKDLMLSIYGPVRGGFSTWRWKP